MPLAVGNEWQFREAIYYDEFTHWGWRITGEAEVEGRSYFELRGCSEDGGASCGEPGLVRYSDEYARVVQYHEEVGLQAAGPHEARLATDALPSGLYLVRLRGDAAEAVQRLVVLR